MQAARFGRGPACLPACWPCHPQSHETFYPLPFSPPTHPPTHAQARVQSARAPRAAAQSPLGSGDPRLPCRRPDPRRTHRRWALACAPRPCPCAPLRTAACPRPRRPSTWEAAAAAAPQTPPPPAPGQRLHERAGQGSRARGHGVGAPPASVHLEVLCASARAVQPLPGHHVRARFRDGSRARVLAWPRLQTRRRRRSPVTWPQGLDWSTGVSASWEGVLSPKRMTPE